MLAIERLFRRFGYAFGFAGLFTAMFNFEGTFYGVPFITFIVGAVLFLSSWRVQKEVLRHIQFENEGTDLVDRLLSKLCKGKKHREHMIWQALYTFGAFIVLLAAAEDLHIEWPLKIKGIVIAGFIIWFIVTRLFDQKINPADKIKE